MAAKAAFSLADLNAWVSGDWVVGVPGLEPGTRWLKVSRWRLAKPAVIRRWYEPVLADAAVFVGAWAVDRGDVPVSLTKNDKFVGTATLNRANAMKLAMETISVTALLGGLSMEEYVRIMDFAGHNPAAADIWPKETPKNKCYDYDGRGLTV